MGGIVLINLNYTVDEIKKWRAGSMEKTKSFDQRLLVEQHTASMIQNYLLSEIVNQFEKVNHNLERLGNELDFIRKKLRGG
jgi:hypothetical protein